MGCPRKALGVGTQEGPRTVSCTVPSSGFPQPVHNRDRGRLSKPFQGISFSDDRLERSWQIPSRLLKLSLYISMCVDLEGAFVYLFFALGFLSDLVYSSVFQGLSAQSA